VTTRSQRNTVVDRLAQLALDAERYGPLRRDRTGPGHGLICGCTRCWTTTIQVPNERIAHQPGWSCTECGHTTPGLGINCKCGATSVMPDHLTNDGHVCFSKVRQLGWWVMSPDPERVALLTPLEETP
jgi:hypothetical protein